MEMRKKWSVKNIIILCIVLSIILTVLDYINLPSIVGLKMTNINWDFLIGILNCIIVIVLYVITYKTLDKRTVERETNKKDISDLLLKECYKECKKYVEMLDEETVEKHILPKMDFNSTDNVIITNLQESPFSNENVIMDFVKDGQMTREEIGVYLKIKEKYRQYITIRIVFYDAPHLYEPIKQDLYKIINVEAMRFEKNDMK